MLCFRTCIISTIACACNIAVNSIKVYKSQVLNLGGESNKQYKLIKCMFFLFLSAGRPCTRQTGKLVYLETVCMIIFMVMTFVICE